MLHAQLSAHAEIKTITVLMEYVSRFKLDTIRLVVLLTFYDGTLDDYINLEPKLKIPTRKEQPLRQTYDL